MLAYATDMKIAISLPDELFEQAEHLADRWELACSELYRRALVEYLARHVPHHIADALDRLAAELETLETRSDTFVSAAGRRVRNRTEW